MGFHNHQVSPEGNVPRVGRQRWLLWTRMRPIKLKLQVKRGSSDLSTLVVWLKIGDLPVVMTFVLAIWIVRIPWESKPILCLSFRKDRTLSWKAILFPCGPWVQAGLFAPMHISTLTSEHISLIEMKIEFQHFQPSQTQPYYSSQCLIHPGN